MLKAILRNRNFISLLLKVFGLINIEEEKNKIYHLIYIVIIQAILDIVSIASLIPLLYTIQDSQKILEYFEKYFSFISKEIIINNMIYIPLLAIFIIVIATFSRLFVIYKTNLFIENIRYKITTKLMGDYINNNIEVEKKTTELAKLVLSEVDQFIIIVFQPTILMLTNIIFFIGIIIYLFFTNIMASLIGTLLLLAFYISFYLFTKNILNKEGIKSESANKGRFKTAIESFNSLKEIKIYKAEKFFINKFNKFSLRFSNTNSTYTSLVASPKYLLEMLVFVALAASILFLTKGDGSKEEIIPLLGTFAFAAYKGQPALSNIIYGINSIEYGSEIINNLHAKLVKVTNLNSRNKNYSRILNSNESNNCIEIKDLNYTYSNNNNKKYIFKENLNFKIKKNAFFIIAGESGSGKSTLLSLISGLIIPTSGEIVFNKYKNESESPKISYLNQDFTLINASISENVAFGVSRDKIDIELIKRCLKKAGIYEYIKSLKGNVYHNLGENGDGLSIGQKQRIALARALYFKPSILLLDEPTSSLDSKNEIKIINTLEQISKETTVIMSTHKIFNLPKYIDIIKLDISGNISRGII